MKVLFITDVHIKNDNLPDVDKLIDYIRTAPTLPSITVIGGDILDTHERVLTQLMNKAYELILACRDRMKTYVLVGNHDYINNSQFCSRGHWLTGLKIVDSPNLTVVDYPLYDNKMVFIPYVPTGRFHEALNLIDNWKKAHVIFAHQEFRGCTMGAITSNEGDVWDASLPPVISGHIHEKHRPQSNIYYPGSVFNHDMAIIDTDTIQDVERIDLGTNRKRIVYCSVSQVLVVDSTTSKVSIEGTKQEIDAFKSSKEYTRLKMTHKVVFRLTKPTHRIQKVRKSFIDFLDELVQQECVALRQDFQELHKEILVE